MLHFNEFHISINDLLFFYQEKWNSSSLIYNLADLSIFFTSLYISIILVKFAFSKSKTWGICAAIISIILVGSRLVDHLLDVSELWGIAYSFAAIIKILTALLLLTVCAVCSYSISNEYQLKRVYAENIKLSWIFSSTNVSIMVYDLKGNIINCNPAAEELFGYTKDELITNDLRLRLPPDETPEIHHNNVQRIIDGETVSGLEIKRVHKSGKLIDITVTATRVYDENNRVVGAVALLNDVTERKTLERLLKKNVVKLAVANEKLSKSRENLIKTNAQLEERNKELKTFTYVASHDLKSPLRAIINLSEWVLEDAYKDLSPSSQRHLKLLHQRTLRMENLLDDLLMYARIGSSKYQSERIDIQRMLHEISGIIDKPLGFNVEIDEALPIIKSHRVPLFQIFYNLIYNAIKHHPSPETGQVKVFSKVEKNFYKFYVQDNGEGIAPEYHHKIFEIFETLKPKDSVDGSGIGLAIVKKITELYKTSIHIESSLGQGTTFIFIWPRYIST